MNGDLANTTLHSTKLFLMKVKSVYRLLINSKVLHNRSLELILLLQTSFNLVTELFSLKSKFTVWHQMIFVCFKSVFLLPYCGRSGRALKPNAICCHFERD